MNPQRHSRVTFEGLQPRRAGRFGSLAFLVVDNSHSAIAVLNVPAVLPQHFPQLYYRAQEVTLNAKSLAGCGSCLEQMHGGEIFVPKIPSVRLVDLAETVAPGCQVEYIGIRPGEKLHEVLVEDESRQTLETEDMYVIQPAHPWWKSENWMNAKPLPEGFRYSSDSNERWLTRRELEELVTPETSAAEAVPTSA